MPRKNAVPKELQCENQSFNGTEYCPYSNSVYIQKILINLNLLRQDSRSCELIAGEKKIHAHRSVLSAGSDYFEAMFRVESQLNEDKNEKSVIIYNISSDILQNLIDFIYVKKISITQDNVMELLQAADMIQLSEVVEGCGKFLSQQLNSTNALGYLQFADTYNCNFLIKSAMKYIQLNFQSIEHEKEFLDIPQDLLNKLLRSEVLIAINESQLFIAALRWIKHDIAQRSPYTIDILKNVRLTFVSTDLIDKAIEDCADLQMKLKLRLIRDDLIFKRGQLVPIEAALPRRVLDLKQNIYNIREKSVFKYDIFKREWSKLASMRLTRVNPGKATLHGKIYVIGGNGSKGILANGEVYDSEKNKWQPIAPMIKSRHKFGICVLNEILYVFGGRVSEGIGSSIECYDPILNEWKMIGNMPKPRFNMGVVSFEGLIYIVGGITQGFRPMRDFISYNPVKNEWKNTLAGLQCYCSQMGVVVLDRYLYVVGGKDIFNEAVCDVQRYSFDEDKWTKVAPMSVERCSPEVEAADDHIFAIGGDRFNIKRTFQSLVECYDPLTDCWEDYTNLPSDC